MARQKKAQTTAEKIERMETVVLQRKAAYDEAVSELKELREKQKKESQDALRKQWLPANGVMKRLWSSFEVILTRLRNKLQKLLLKPYSSGVE